MYSWILRWFVVMIGTGCLVAFRCLAWPHPPSDSHEPSANSNKIALIVALGQYHPDTGWPSLHAHRDVKLVMAALAAQGFDTLRNVSVLQDQEATRSGITEAIRQQLVEKAQPGTIAVLHYSGHGQQVFDDNSDELDGYDEALVPYDAPRMASGTFTEYRGERHLRDDELGALLTELRHRIGPTGDVTVVLDACHSGTATRGDEDVPARGTHHKIAPAGYQPPMSRVAGNDWNEEEGTDGLAPLVVISGSGANQLNYEARDERGQLVGSLSYAFSRALTGASAHQSYQGLFDKIKIDMGALVARQTPQLEGATHREILGGKALSRPEYYRTKEWLDKEHLSIRGGRLLGLLPGTEVAFYPIDTRDTSRVKPMATGTIVTAYPLESDVELNQPLSEKKATNSWVYVTNKNLGDMSVSVGIPALPFPGLTTALRQALTQYSFVTIDTTRSELWVTTDQNNQLRLMANGGHVLYQETATETTADRQAERIGRQVTSYARAKFLRQITTEESDLQVEVTLQPVTVRRNGRQTEVAAVIPREEKTDPNGTLILKNGDHFQVKVTNVGKQRAYFCILDIQPDNVTNPMVPNGSYTAEEYVVDPGSTMQLKDIFTVAEPYGTETLKIIATREPIENIGPLVTHRGNPPASEDLSSLHPLERLLQATYREPSSGTRGVGTVRVPPSSGSISTLLFRIEE